MANENIITQRKNLSKKTQNVSSRKKKKLRRSGVLTIGFKSSIYRLKVRVSSQLRTPTVTAARIARKTWSFRGGSQLRDILISAVKATRLSTFSALASHSSIFIFVYFNLSHSGLLI